MDQEDLYDEFGNYIGPQIESQNSSEHVVGEEEQAPKQTIFTHEHRIVLHEDKKFYQTHEELYPGAQIMIEQEDRQTLQTPLVSTEHERFYDYYEEIDTYYKREYLVDVVKEGGNSVRNVAIVGHLHHGKSSFADILVQLTHLRNPQWNPEKTYRWLDTRVDEQKKELSIKATPISLLLQDYSQKHSVFNIVDSPGHPNFLGQTIAAMRLTDGVLLVVDVIEGSMLMTQKLVKHIVRERLGVVVVLNKLDRLILQLKIPPEDAYLKIKHTLEEVNGLFLKASQQLGRTNEYKIAPVLGNVLFAASQYSLVFSLDSMARLYAKKFQGVDRQVLANILWGDYYFNQETRKFQRTAPQSTPRRTFVEFIIEPIYKLFSHVVGKDRPHLENFLDRHLQIVLLPDDYKRNVRSLLKIVIKSWLGYPYCVASAVLAHIGTSTKGAERIVSSHYKGSGPFREQIKKGSPEGPLLVNFVKLYHDKDYKTFLALGRVVSGKLTKNAKLKIMGQSYITGNEQDLFIRQATKLYLLQGRYRIEVDSIPAGGIVLVEGLDQAITKTATAVSYNQTRAEILSPLKFWSEPTIRIAVEPLIPNELPKLIEAIRRVNKSYLMLKTKVEQSGEHVLIGNGQMQLDCILHDIRLLYSDIQVRISDPTVTFSETVAQTSGVPCHADTPNKKNRIRTLAGPLDRSISETVEKQLIDISNKAALASFMQEKHGWDELASQNIWSFGPQYFGTNALINDSLVSEHTNQQALGRVQQSVVQGFKWSTREGPLCDQPMRNVKFRVIDAQIGTPLESPPGQIIPTARRSFYSSFLTGCPRLMEPVYYTEIQCTTKESIQAVFAVLAKRRGSIQNDVPRAGTPHYIIRALLPCIEALGFETDLRVHTVGQAFCVSTFDHWQVIPGDPLDKKIVLRPLQVLQPHEIAREFMVKTRRRKGLNEQVSIVKYFDDLNVKELLKNDATFKDFI